MLATMKILPKGAKISSLLGISNVKRCTFRGYCPGDKLFHSHIALGVNDKNTDDQSRSRLAPKHILLACIFPVKLVATNRITKKINNSNVRFLMLVLFSV